MSVTGSCSKRPLPTPPPPAGRVLNRFSKDIGQLDSNMPWILVDFTQVRMDVAFSSFLFYSFL